MSLLKLLSVFLFFYCCQAAIASPFDVTKDLPIAYQGRFRSLDAASRLWLSDIYHRQELRKQDEKDFAPPVHSSIELLWRFHLLGHPPFDAAPLFWLNFANVKSLMGLETTKDRFSYNELVHAIYKNKETNLRIMQLLLPYEFARNFLSPLNRSKNKKLELDALAPGLWIIWQKNNNLVIAASPKQPPWNLLDQGITLITADATQLLAIEKQNKAYADEILRIFNNMHAYAEVPLTNPIDEKQLEAEVENLQSRGLSSIEIKQTLESRYPLMQRLKNAGSTLKMLPSKFEEGEWISLHALKLKTYDSKSSSLSFVSNFTLFSDDIFNHIRSAYLEIEALTKNNETDSRLQLALEAFTNEIFEGYGHLAGTNFRKASGKVLSYPSTFRLKVETWYYRIPFIEIAIFLYLIAIILFLASYSLKKSFLNHCALFALSTGFITHTLVLGLRCYVLQRPPVSNMFETIIYVPWISIILGGIYYIFSKQQLVLIISCVASISLLILLKLTHVDERMENVQAVLDSQYWLIVHVLMVVGSYGAFIVAGLLGHLYLIFFARFRNETSSMRNIARSILHMMYTGVALLIPGTILGGVWAAESWGRFWDWDPKESWAFISACIYLLTIHAYTFHHIRDFGLAIGSVAGLVAISFTWYGVNYILGTGLHSYGFGKGGENYYFLFLIAESLFLFGMIFLHFYWKTQQKLLVKNK